MKFERCFKMIEGLFVANIHERCLRMIKVLLNEIIHKTWKIFVDDWKSFVANIRERCLRMIKEVFLLLILIIFERYLRFIEDLFVANIYDIWKFIEGVFVDSIHKWKTFEDD